jgi:outer membrane lipoprotein-sorting protein
MKSIKLTVFSLVFLFIFSGFAAAAPNSLIFDQIITAGGRTTASKVWLKDKNLRMETKVEGQEMVTIIKDNKYYNYTPAAKIATVISLHDDEITKETMQYPKDYMAFLKSRGAKFAGSASIDGKPAQIYQYANKDGTNVKVWVWEKKNFPLKMVFLHGSNRSSTILWKNVQFNASVPDNLFEFAPGTRVIDMTQGIPKM